ncbi:hypothetical protein [Lacticaseibacillus kribbianus]|uniref:hypothetical protein n=1 Tax=Lacticaseibacillus kribbianus TaxID=2926292 RepID=UPI001CD70E7F|nr:hypothetical protein [Lacticaseibacillus kribbianus]
MKTQFGFELKTLPWRLLILCWLAIIGGVGAVANQVTTELWMGYSHTQSVRSEGERTPEENYTHANKDELYDFYRLEAQYLAKNDRVRVKQVTDWTGTDVPTPTTVAEKAAAGQASVDAPIVNGLRRDAAFFQRAARLLARGELVTFNRALADKLQHDHGVVDRNVAVCLFKFGLDTERVREHPDDAAVMRVWNRVAPQRLLQADAYSSALNLTLMVFNPLRSEERQRPNVAIYLIIAAAALMTVATAFRGAPRYPDILMRVAPIGPSTRAFLKLAAVWLALNVILVAAVAVVTLVIAVSPAHDFGVWRFPLLFPNGGKARLIVPLWQVALRVLGFFNLWFALIGAATHALRQVTREVPVALLVIGVSTFADFFSLLQLLPGGCRATT